MSSILKALKKLEEEKNRRQQGKVDIATDILRATGRSGKRNWLMPLILVVLVLGGTLGGMYVARMFLPEAMRQPVQSQPVQSQPVQSQPVQSQPVQSQPVQSQPVQSQPVQSQPVQSQPVQSQPVQSQPVQSQPVDRFEHPRLVVSGIAYQANAENRMAVVNDLPVLAGTTVAGVEVVEILPDKVVFRFKGKQFSVPLSDLP
ncbi:hypothetical protein C2E25_11845 [Geothermobacter hydrogeniphilus]|uniref:Type II secretion system protein GspB C-terminal domain-containing protein n=1 Tax=Geothermobacter hydrogeniphilus TaxID=1969733 RepID=A0A2K2H888_9BACT|nr:general secretion pathway protein GspB [Geothermobacter hydrogeniphilus]PNU19524.1 hypothetical protein C2E25_11845 [Geothermobacter hydrogeniphilus]